MEPRLVWKYAGKTASLIGEKIVAKIALNEPNRGLLQVGVMGSDLSGNRFLQLDILDPQAEVEDCYVRGNDLIATYPQSRRRNSRPQVYWRFAADSDNLPIIDLFVSMQTSQLDSDPSLSVRTNLTSGETFVLSDGTFEPVRAAGTLRNPLVVHRWENLSDISYVEMVHPSDVDISQVRFLSSEKQPMEIDHRLFQHDLEKGVIRRGRIRSAFVPRIGDLPTALRLYDQLATSPPPLTT